MSALSRRTLVSSAAALSALAVPAIASADPVFELIERHKAAIAEWSAMGDELADLERAIPLGLRRSDDWTGGGDIVEGDDPRWIDFIRRYAAASNAMEGAGFDLIDSPPTTVAGVAALLSYMVEHIHHYDEQIGFQSRILPEDAPEGASCMACRDPEWFIMRTAANALRAIA
jgi:hypothetical protein